MATSIVKLPPFIEAKVRVWYRIHNKKRNGFMSREDFVELANTFISEYNLNEKTSAEVRSWLLDGWSALISYSKTMAGKDALITAETTPKTLEIAEKLSKGEKITEDLYVSAYKEVLFIDSDIFPTCFKNMVTVFFNIFDTDADGYITEDDIVRGLKCFGFEKSEAVRAVFGDLDKNRSGKVDRATYIAAWMEFMAGTDTEAAMAKHFTADIL